MALADLLHGFVPEERVPAMDVYGLSLDTRTLVAGDAFVALAGARHHGLEFAARAQATGASAVLYEPTGAQPAILDALDIPCIAIPDLAHLASELGARYHARPAEAMDLVGVTGTNGKTSLCWLLAQAWTALGKTGAVMGTLGVGTAQALRKTGMTTPDALSVQRELARLYADGVDRCAIEVSSHALDQQRMSAVPMSVAVFTNLTRDHLDYHGDLEQYGRAKARMFSAPGLEHAVINIADAFGRKLATQTRANVISYGVEDASVFASMVNSAADGLRFQLHVGEFSASITSGLLGEFNVMNLLAVAGALLAQGESAARIAALLPGLQAPPGRMQRISGAPVQPIVIVDYAHTPDALQQALGTARGLCRGKLVCVFGCGGERDVGKRAQMGRVANAADAVVLTEDNSRGEDVYAICRQIQSGLAADVALETIADRGRAIRYAIQHATANDVVLIAGKGHEDTLQRDGTSIRFSDPVCASKELRKWGVEP